MTPEQRAVRARIASHTRWSREPDRVAATAPARAAKAERYERQVDPDGVLSPEERALRADHARKADMLRLSLKSAAARRKKAR